MNVGKPLVSFVVPLYNYGRYVRECLDAILGQEGGYGFEIVVVDDASTDDGLDIVRSYGDDRIRTIEHETNLGHGATVAEGLHAARGQFIVRVDPDDRHRSHFLKSTLPKFNDHPDVALVYGDAAQIDEVGALSVESSDHIHGGRDFKGNELVQLLKENFICSPTVIARSEVWLEALPIPDHLAFHDWWFTLMMARKHDFYFVAQTLADYRVHPLNHHARIVSDGSEEKSVLWLLEKIYSEPEKSEALENEKRRSKHHIYGAQYLTLARKYFGFGMYADARRCYLRAVRHRPALLTKTDIQRQLAGTFIGRGAYERIKGFRRSEAARPRARL